MARPPKALVQHLRDRSFRPARHGHLLGDPSEPLPPRLDQFRERYPRAQSARARHAVVLDFADAIEGQDTERRRPDPLLAASKLGAAALARVERVRALSWSDADQRWNELRSIIDAPAVRSATFKDRDAVHRFWRACSARGLHGDGLCISEIGARLRVSPSTIQRDLNELERGFAPHLAPYRQTNSRERAGRGRYRATCRCRVTSQPRPLPWPRVGRRRCR
jgi:hypothetical protein